MLSWQQSLDKKLSSGGVASLVGLAPRKLEALPEAAKEAIYQSGKVKSLAISGGGLCVASVCSSAESQSARMTPATVRPVVYTYRASGYDLL